MAESAFRLLRLPLAGMVLASGTWLFPPILFAQDSDNTEFVRPQREFGELPSWQNQMGYDRMPVSEKLLLGAPIRREGLTPRLTLTEEYTDNVFFTARNRGTDYITKIAPGLGYRSSGRDGQLSVDYSVESRVYANNINQNRAVSRQNGELFGIWNLSDRTSLTVFDRFESFQDPTEQQIPGILGAFGRTSINIAALMVKHRLTPSVDLLANYGNFRWSVDAPGAIDSMTHEGEVGARVRETQWGRTTVKYRFRFFDFQQGRDFQSHSALITQEMDLSETLVVSGTIGAVRVEPDPSTVEVLAQASIKKSLGDALYELSYMRDVFPPSGGLSQPLVGDFVRASTKIRLANNFLFDAGLTWILTSTSSDDLTVHTLKWNVGISYTPASWLVARLGYDMFDQREDILGTSANRLANKVSLRMIATF
ncbi:MAG: outer membrane beta-barrel protein [Nitrospira sp.]|nr:outer membrane beta-barrel protein [Nitrospira sp.]